MRHALGALALLGLLATPALAQQAAPGCGCPVSPPAAARPYRPATYHPATYHRRRPAPVEGYATTITPVAPVMIGQGAPVRYLRPANQEPIAGLGVFLTPSGTGYGPNGNGLDDSGITDGVMGAEAGAGGPGPSSIGW